MTTRHSLTLDMLVLIGEYLDRPILFDWLDNRTLHFARDGRVFVVATFEA